MTTGPYWSLILPVAGTNLSSNPSAELDATGWAGTGNGTINRQAGTAAFGAWAIGGTANGAAGGTGLTYGTVSMTAGSYTVSGYVYAQPGSVYSIGMKGTGAGGAFVGSTVGTGGGSWHRYSFSYGEASDTRRFFSVVQRQAGGAPFFVDAVQVESGTFLTTYMDGDQEGCTWLGNPQASQSQRSGTARQGGTVVNLQSLGWTVLEMGGVGMPPVENVTQKYAILDGAVFQRQRADSRVFALTSFMSGSTWPGLHAVRQQVVNAVKINRGVSQQPVRFFYTGQGGTAQIDGYYDGGMEYTGRDGFTETTAIRFVATDPMWYGVTDQGTALAAQVTLGSANYIVKRAPNGQWGTLGFQGTTFSAGPGGAFGTAVQTILPTSGGSVYIGGDFGSVAGTRSGGLVLYFPATNTFGTLVGGTVFATLDMALSPSGTLFAVSRAGGEWNGTQAAVGVYANNAWGTIQSNFLLDYNAVVFAPSGTLYLGGEGIGPRYWTGGVTATNLPGGTPTGVNYDINDIAIGPDGALVAAGLFGAVFGSTTRSIYTYVNGTAGTMSSGMLLAGGTATLFSLSYGPNGVLYAAGIFDVAGGGSALDIAAWNGNQWQALNTGLTSPNGVGNGGGSAYATNCYVTRAGSVFAAGFFSTAGNIPVPNSIAQYTGAAWIPMDILLPSWARVNTVTEAGDRTLYLGGSFYGSAQAAAVAQVVNAASNDSYPVAVIRNTSSSNARVYQLVNYTTGDAMWFNLSLLPSETLTVDLRQGRKTVTSNVRGNVIGQVIPGSNTTTWRLAPGTNNVSFFAGTSGVETTFYWRPRQWSADSP